VKDGRHRYRPRHGLARHRRRQRVGATVMATVVAASTAGILPYATGRPAQYGSTPILARVDIVRSVDRGGSRDRVRTQPPASHPARSAAPKAAPGAAPTSPPAPPGRPSPPAPPAPPALPAPVAGLDRAEMANAAIIVKVGARRGLPKRAQVIAIATALQESNLYNVASTAVPESFRYPHQGVSSDHDSVGLFQQRPSQGWGAVAQLMDPAHSAGLFYDRLVRVPGWQVMSLTAAAQAVQRSAFPGAYSKHEPRAEQIVAAFG
jgi:hypothetical protein